jgi:hypothetical protein
MAGLETLDETLPRDTDPVSLGDDTIRETRQKTKTSFSAEHYLDGPHKIPSFTNATRPPAGRVGRVAYNTDTKSMEYDNGTTWMGIADATARATILSHLATFTIASGANAFELPFDFVIDDPWNYALTGNHQINQPDNSMGIATAYVEFSPGPDVYGVLISIQQLESGSWINLAQHHSGPTTYLNVTTLVDSRWGKPLRCVLSNLTSKTISIATTPGGRTPRFAYAMLGRTS